MDRSQLRQMIITYFSLEDFKDLCFELGTYGVSYDALAGDGLPPKARELILLCERAGIQPALIAACRRLRPNVQWEDEPPRPATGQPSPLGPSEATPPPVVAPPGPPPSLAPTLRAADVASGETATDALDPHFTLLLRSILSGRLVPFLGADVNLLGRPTDAGWALGQHFPSTGEMATYLATRLKELGYPPPESDDLASITEHASLTLGVGSLYDELRTVLNADYPPTGLHDLLASLPGLLRERGYPSVYQIIVTSNFDDVLERAFQGHGEPCDVLTYTSREDIRGKFIHAPHGDTPRAIERPNEYDALPLDQRTIIVKIYGALNRLNPDDDSYTITEDDFIGYMSRADITSLLPATLVSRVRKSHFLFLGSSLRDWNRRVVFQRVWDEQKLQYKSWAVPFDPRISDEEFWRRRDIELIRNITLQEYVDRFAARLAALPPVGG